MKRFTILPLRLFRWSKKNRWNRFFTLWIIGFTVVNIWNTIDLQRQIQKEKIAAVALCRFKSDLQTRYDQGLQFQEEHPKGIPGISAAVIKTSLTNQAATLKSLSILRNCKKGT